MTFFFCLLRRTSSLAASTSIGRALACTTLNSFWFGVCSKFNMKSTHVGAQTWWHQMTMTTPAAKKLAWGWPEVPTTTQKLLIKLFIWKSFNMNKNWSCNHSAAVSSLPSDGKWQAWWQTVTVWRVKMDQKLCHVVLDSLNQVHLSDMETWAWIMCRHTGR